MWMFRREFDFSVILFCFFFPLTLFTCPFFAFFPPLLIPLPHTYPRLPILVGNVVPGFRCAFKKEEWKTQLPREDSKAENAPPPYLTCALLPPFHPPALLPFLPPSRPYQHYYLLMPVSMSNFGYLAPGFRYIRGKGPNSKRGYSLNTTKPLTNAIGTGPYDRESVELNGLSPSSQSMPGGISRTCSCWYQY